MMNQNTGDITLSVVNHRKVRSNSTGVRVNYYSLNRDGTKVKVHTSNQYNYGSAQSLQREAALGDDVEPVSGGSNRRDGWRDDDGTFILSRTIPRSQYFRQAEISFKPNTANVRGDDFVQEIDNVIEMMGEEGEIIVRPNAAFRGGTLDNERISNLMQQRGERIRDALVERGVDSGLIEINLGNPDSGGTSTEFELK